MRWFPVVFVMLAMLTLQTAVVPHLSLLGARPDWLLVLVVFFSFHAAPHEAYTVAFLTGITADLMSVERLGLLAASYLLVSVLVVSVRGYLFRLEAATQFFTVLFACLLVRTGWMIYARIHYDFLRGAGEELLFDVLGGSLYTALWAPPWHGGLFRMVKVLGLPRPRYTFAAGG
ncbi:MAG: rod shape-determining protein MreD [Planctomycetota bacterium]|nr:MAG: rod shape-determining protein MreD [Planctomycetota bacterium]